MKSPDLVVVGAGSAGCVIASRVSETRARVLLLEAGPDYPDELPPDLRNGNHNSVVAHDWGLRYEPRPGTNAPFPRGKVVGGSSAVNTCIALRGEPDDYDEWARIAGPEWHWERCLPAFRRLESDADFGALEHHGANGPLPIVRYPDERLHPVQREFLDACASLGHPSSPDHNEPGSTGYGRTPLNKSGDERVSAASAYLSAARSRTNLEIRPGSPVAIVEIERGRVRGVRLESGESIACEHVVLCAGAIMTPAILARSGVPVGGRLADHPGTLVLLRYPRADGSAPLMQACMRLTVRERNDLFVEPLTYARAGMAGIAVAAYRSYGSGCLRTDPMAIESRFHSGSDDRDLRLMVDGVRHALAIASRIGHDGIVGLDANATDEEIRAHVLRFTGSGYHPCGTFPMGTSCDEYGRVDGIAGLRVADASIMPTVPRANTNIPTLMIGERFGEWLSQEVGA